VNEERFGAKDVTRPFGPLTGEPKVGGAIGVVDIETWGLDATPNGFALAVIRTADGTRRFGGIASLVDYLTGRVSRGRTWYAHNGGRYDYLSIFGNLWSFFGRDNLSINGSKLIEARVNDGNGNVIRFRDSFNLMPVALAKIGESLGYPKGQTPQKFIDGDRSKGITNEDYAYCEQDCNILYRALTEFQDELGELRPTIASTAMAIFRRHYFPERDGPIWVRHDKDYLFRRAYFGGRVEAYRIGELPKPTYYYDVNSLFPFAMVTTNLPDPSRLRHRSEIGVASLERLMDENEGCASVRLRHPLARVGTLPFRRSDGRLLFPIGSWSGWYCFPELRWALSHGVELEAANEVVYSEPFPTPFGGYVDRFYKMKSQATGFRREIAKYLLNGLYGKFGEHHDGREVYADKLDPAQLAAYREQFGEEADWTPISYTRDDGYYTLPDNERKYASHSVYSWAAYITSRARVLNLEWQERLEKCGAEVLYTDTDSFLCYGAFVTSGPANADMVGDAIGRLKLEDTDVSHVWGNKHYETRDGTTKLKGVKRGAAAIGYNPLTQRPNIYQYRAVRPLKQAIRFRVAPGSPYIGAKAISYGYDKRIVHADGTTEPVRIDE
jgi:DNA polymerase type B, organellar and viral